MKPPALRKDQTPPMTVFKGFLRGEVPAGTPDGSTPPMTTPFGTAVAEISRRWAHDRRWAGIKRTYGPADVVRLRGSVHVEFSLARQGAEHLWWLLHTEDYISALGALTGRQARG